MKPIDSTPLKYSFVLMSVLAIAWLLWSGFYKPLLLGLGLLSCLITWYVARRMDAIESVYLCVCLLPRIVGYWLWLIKEVAISSFGVAKIILTPKLPISPIVVELNGLPEGPLGQAILGNSISFTPGSITTDVHQGKFRVHCITQAGADALLEGHMNRRVAALTDK